MFLYRRYCKKFCSVPNIHRRLSHNVRKTSLIIFFICETMILCWYKERFRFLSGLYYGVTIAIVSSATAMTVLTLNIHHKGSRGIEVPHLVKRIFFEIIAKILFIKLDLPAPPPGPGLVGLFVCFGFTPISTSGGISRGVSPSNRWLRIYNHKLSLLV